MAFDKSTVTLRSNTAAEADYTDKDAQLTIDEVDDNFIAVGNRIGEIEEDVYLIELDEKGIALSTGTNIAYIVMPYAGAFTDIKCTVDVAPTGASIIIDANLNGSTIMTTDKIEIDATQTDSDDSATQPALTTTAFAAGDILSFDLDQVGSTIEGEWPVVTIKATRT